MVVASLHCLLAQASLSIMCINAVYINVQQHNRGCACLTCRAVGLFGCVCVLILRQWVHAAAYRGICHADGVALFLCDSWQGRSTYSLVICPHSTVQRTLHPHTCPSLPCILLGSFMAQGHPASRIYLCLFPPHRLLLIWQCDTPGCGYTQPTPTHHHRCCSCCRWPLFRLCAG